MREDESAELGRLTKLLITASQDGGQELERFRAIRDRQMAIPEAKIDSWLRGRTILVTGGTGCVGTELMRRIAQHQPGGLVSVSRGRMRSWPRLQQAEYATADVTDQHELGAVFERIRPDVVFHLAAQRDPGLAERNVRETVSTNVLGTLNVIDMVERYGTTGLVAASSGKAVRPYSSEVYTSSKRTAEWLLAGAADRSSQCRYAAVRFTHVVDNSIIYKRLENWCRSGVLRLHGPDVMFYVQSARESAQLLLCAGLFSDNDGLRIFAQTDLGWPIDLLHLAVGMLTETQSHSPIYFSGHDLGYEDAAFPGLYDPRTAGQFSPLLNAFEATEVEQRQHPAIDILPVKQTPCRDTEALLARLETECMTDASPEQVRAALATLNWALFEGAMSAAPLETLVRARRLAEPYRSDLSAEHRRMLAVITRHENSRELAATAPGSSRSY